jgi:transcriptional regulator with XRE-family HTH domain
MAATGIQATEMYKLAGSVTHGMSAFGTELARLMGARGLGVHELARQVPCNPGHISNLRSGKAQPSAGLAADLDKALRAGGALAALAPPLGRVRPAGPDFLAADDEIAALELARRAGASDVGNSVIERLQLAVDELAVAYPGTAPDELLGRVRAHLV